MYVKNRMPMDMIYYNVLYDTKKVIEELKTRMIEISNQDPGDPDISSNVDIKSSTDQVEAPKKLTHREKSDIKKSIAFYKEKRKSEQNDMVIDTLQYILDNY